jgi:hydantoinase/carbamoylase family amidase
VINNRIIKTLNKINEFGRTKNGMFRLAYSEAERKVHQFFIAECKSLGMDVRVDTAGNIIARRKGLDESLPAVAIGSHLDTVYSGGEYDGSLGVAAGLEIVRALVKEGIETLHPIEVICFACEESARFSFATLGSKAMVGSLNQESLKLLKDRDGISLSEAFKENGLDLQDLRKAKRYEKELKVFFELHIEQGTKLIENCKKIGIVTGVAAPLRLAVSIEGKSSHSGTTGMTERRDALLAAAELSLAVEEAALAESQYETVATVGVLDISPGAMNVVPGEAKLKIDIRSTEPASRARVFAKVKEKIVSLETKRKVKVRIDWVNEENPIMMDEAVGSSIASICEEHGISYQFMPSGAGHDAMNMAKVWPTALVFVPSVDGVSHHPDEFTAEEDILEGFNLLKQAVLNHAICSKGGTSWNHAELKSSQM